jgi:hypothetical protein
VSTRKRRILLIIAALLVLLFVMGQIDFQRVARGEKPVFARWSRSPADGGSAEYPFVGYTVTAMHRIDGMTSEGKRYRVGPKLDYWIPFVGRDQTTFYVRTNRLTSPFMR